MNEAIAQIRGALDFALAYGLGEGERELAIAARENCDSLEAEIERGRENEMALVKEAALAHAEIERLTDDATGYSTKWIESSRRVGELEAEVEQLTGEQAFERKHQVAQEEIIQRQRAEIERLTKLNAKIRGNNYRLASERDDAQAEKERLRAVVEVIASPWPMTHDEIQHLALEALDEKP